MLSRLLGQYLSRSNRMAYKWAGNENGPFSYTNKIIKTNRLLKGYHHFQASNSVAIDNRHNGWKIVDIL